MKYNIKRFILLVKRLEKLDNIKINLKGVSLKGGTQYRIKNINLTVKNGERIALIGRSGSGKSSLIAVANGTLTPQIGEVNIFSVPIEKLSNRKKADIGTIWQDLHLIEELNVIQNIHIGALGKNTLFWAIKNLIGIVNNQECISCLLDVELTKDFLYESIQNLSGGEKQRVAIARLLAQNPDIILADEPISNLEPSLGLRMLKILLGIPPVNTKVKPSISIISLHRPDLTKYFTRVIGLNKGKIVIDESSEKMNQSKIDLVYKK